MKRKWIGLFIGSLVLISVLLGWGVAYSFGVGSVDGVWGNIDGVVATGGRHTIDIIGYGARIANGLRPSATDQGYVLQSAVCSGKQNINPTWPDATRWTSTGVNWTGFGAHTTTCTNAPDLFFSQYVYNQRTDLTDQLAIEIYNGTGASVSLTNYYVYLFTADREATVVNLSGTVANGGTHVIKSGNLGTPPTAQQTFTSTSTYRTVVLVYDSGTPEVEGARCNRWATGPGNNPTVYSDLDPAVQSGPTTDENQVRYGREAYYTTTWQSYDCSITNFAKQSGFGFNGRDDAIEPQALVPFFLGKFTHYNNQVFSTNNTYDSTSANPLNYVDLSITVPVTCNDGSTPTPATFTFVPRFFLDETPNSAGTCVYGEVGDVPCPDRVTIEMPSANPTFTCPEGDYTVNILGFTSKGLGTDPCDVSYDPDAVSSAYVTQEDQDNSACLWARIEQPLADISVAKTCWDFNTQDPYYVITTSNFGPGFARAVTLQDVLPNGVLFKSYTSQLVTTSGTINQGTCGVSGQTVNCSLNTPLLDFTTDPLAKWVVRIYVDFGVGNDIHNTVTVSTITTDPNLSNNTDTADCDPTSAELCSFTAESKPGGIALNWETTSEVDTLGFNVLRANSPEGIQVKINTQLIPSKSFGGGGAVYDYFDVAIIKGMQYHYWLEMLSSDRITTFGPLNVWSLWFYHLPLLIK